MDFLQLPALGGIARYGEKPLRFACGIDDGRDRHIPPGGPALEDDVAHEGALPARDGGVDGGLGQPAIFALPKVKPRPADDLRGVGCAHGFHPRSIDPQEHTIGGERGHPVAAALDDGAIEAFAL